MSRKSVPAWVEAPLPATMRLHPVLKIGPGEPRSFSILSPRAFIVPCHYDLHSKRSFPCLEPVMKCPWDHATHRQCWQGWVAVQGWPGKQWWWLALTYSAMRDEPRLQQKQPHLRGCTLTVGRRGNGPTCRMIAVVQEPRHGPEELLPEPDIYRFLDTLWGGCRFATSGEFSPSVH